MPPYATKAIGPNPVPTVFVLPVDFPIVSAVFPHYMIFFFTLNPTFSKYLITINLCRQSVYNREIAGIKSIYYRQIAEMGATMCNVQCPTPRERKGDEGSKRQLMRKLNCRSQFGSLTARCRMITFKISEAARFGEL
jgi:hypothetical protein